MLAQAVKLDASNFFEEVSMDMYYKALANQLRDVFYNQYDNPSICGSIKFRIARKGDLEHSVFLCKDWRSCDNCRRERSVYYAIKLQELALAVEANGLKLQYFSSSNDAEYKKQQRAVSKHGFMSFPVDDGIYLASHVLEDYDVTIDPFDFDPALIHAITETPEGKRVGASRRKSITSKIESIYKNPETLDAMKQVAMAVDTTIPTNMPMKTSAKKEVKYESVSNDDASNEPTHPKKTETRSNIVQEIVATNHEEYMSNDNPVIAEVTRLNFVTKSMSDVQRLFDLAYKDNINFELDRTNIAVFFRNLELSIMKHAKELGVQVHILGTDVLKYTEKDYLELAETRKQLIKKYT